MMTPMVRSETVSVWWDGEIKPSQKWRAEIEKGLASAKVGVLLVSAHFLASDFINDHELPYLLDAADEQGVKIIWVLVGNCLYDQTRIVEYQAAHDISKPLKSLTEAELDDVLVEICRAIAEAASDEPNLMASVKDPPRQKPKPRTVKAVGGALAIWQEKLAYFQEQEAITADPAQKFALRKQIEEAKRQIQELSS